MCGIYCATTSSAISFNTAANILSPHNPHNICSIIALSGSLVCYSVGLNIVISGSKNPLPVVFIKAVSADILEMPLVEILEGQIDNSGVPKGVNIR